MGTRHDKETKKEMKYNKEKQSHTPGSWHVHIGKAWNEIDVVDSNNGFVASCIGEVRTRMDEANARLIAAAPDYKWLAERAFTLQNAKHIMPKWTKEEIERSWREWADEFRKVSAKAEGGTR